MSTKERPKKKYYNNGIINKMYVPGTEPDGFVLGMLPVSEEQRAERNRKRKATTLKKYGVTHIALTDEVKEKKKQTNLKKYGVENVSQVKEIQEKKKQTFQKRYGGTSSMASEDVKEKIKETNLKKYGVENVFQSNEIKQRIIATNLERYGTHHPMQNKEVFKKSQDTLMKHFGVRNPLQSKEIKEKLKNTNQKKYGVNWACQRKEFINGGSNDSLPNRKFAKKLKIFGISYEREFPLGNYSYDFKVGNKLVEINPSPTHNTAWNPFGDHVSRINKNYHKDKTRIANENGYSVIHVFDWDEKEKIIDLLVNRKTTYARKCVVKEVPKNECDEYLTLHHMQGTCKGQVIRIGLYYEDKLVSIMTFGNPRYNKNYQYELLRYCSHYNVVGGDKKLFKYFITNYHPDNVISYCDKSKFSGKVYNNLGFSLLRLSTPSRHWYNPMETRKHITDSFLRQRGYDQLFNENYGKGTSNEELMLLRGYLPVYDCGQATYVWKREEK